MAINPNWSRWIFASAIKHFNAHKGDLFLYVEGEHRDTDTENNIMELRVDGPYSTELVQDYFRLYVEINVLIQTVVQGVNLYQHRTNIGVVEAAFTKSMLLYKLGGETGDTGDLVTCLRLESDQRGKQRVQTSDFGIIRPHTELQQATVEGHYEIYLEV